MGADSDLRSAFAIAGLIHMRGKNDSLWDAISLLNQDLTERFIPF